MTAAAMPGDILLAVAPNGARRTKADHPGLPLTVGELIDTAVACEAAGAGMMHFHVRDPAGRHSLDPNRYRGALAALQAEVGDRLLLQVSSEAAGVYGRGQQIEAMRRLAPPCLSCSLREFIADEGEIDSGAPFFADLHRDGSLIQYILYSPADVQWFVSLVKQGVLPGERHFLLFVFGRYPSSLGVAGATCLADYLAPLKDHAWPVSWMVCGFGPEEMRLAVEAVPLGGHIRVGFENNLHRPGGGLAMDNAEQVGRVAALARRYGRQPAGGGYARLLHR